MSIPNELSYLYEIGQEHLLQQWSRWPYIVQRAFVRQVTSYNAALFHEQQAGVHSSSYHLPILKTPSRAILEKTNSNYLLGESLLRENKVGLLLLSGGQGSRLGFSGPKGCMPLPKLQKRTLFSILLSKCKELQQNLGVQLPIAIMTSPTNYWPTLTYLKNNHFFSLLPEQITIFQQQSFPLLDTEMNWYIQSPGLMGMGAGGNGAAFSDGKSILQNWKRKGIEWIQVIPIDNPLATPFDPYLIGCHLSNQSDLVISTMERNAQDTNVGLIGENNGKVYVQEYMNAHLQSDLSLAYLGIFSCHIDLALQWKNSFLWHCVKRNGMRYCTGGTQQCLEIWKLEKFLFDIFPLSNKFSLLIDERERCFSPIKSLYGKYSLESAQSIFIKQEKKILELESNP